MLEAILALIAALAAITPGLVQLFLEAKATHAKHSDAIIGRDISVLGIELDKLRKP